MRTHILVGESAVLIMLCGLFLSEKTGGADPTRIPAQLLSGIGFNFFIVFVQTNDIYNF